ncbi:hypothetical protein JW898_03565 [Candidatus Woesearchaeota archaeon]|nr:hypothetical protein [Candidatus Woesearchaeota archaeon]
MIKKAYGMIGAGEKEDYARLLALEINSYLSKIYGTMKRKIRLEHQKVRPEQLIVMHASLGATKAWEFVPNPRDAAAKGDVGKIKIASRGLDNDTIRKQRALFIAAEFYTFHAFANHPNPEMYSSITGQNQYWDILRKIFRQRNAHETRDRAVRYIVEEVKEHKLASFGGHGWFTSLAKLKQHHPDISEMIGSSEQTFNEIFRKQHQRFTPDMLRQEEDLLRKEREDIGHIAEMLRQHEKKKHDTQSKKLIRIHMENLVTFRNVIDDIIKNFHKWELAEKEEHNELKKRIISPAEMREMLKAESEAEKIDMNKVHILFSYFKKEKINILRDLELLDRAIARHHKS